MVCVCVCGVCGGVCVCDVCVVSCVCVVCVCVVCVCVCVCMCVRCVCVVLCVLCVCTRVYESLSFCGQVLDLVCMHLIDGATLVWACFIIDCMAVESASVHDRSIGVNMCGLTVLLVVELNRR